MNRAAPLVLLLLLVGCRPDAIHARVQVSPRLAASCIALDVLSMSGEVLHTEQVVRSPGKDTVNIAVFQGKLPQEVRLQARARWGSECEEGTLKANGRSATVDARFEREVGSYTLDLSLSAAEDADGDGFLSGELGGLDCDDSRDARNPAAQEVCDAIEDRNCNGLRGCEDYSACGAGCVWVPASLAFTQGRPESIVGDCAGPITLERLGVSGEPSLPAYETRFTLKSEFPGTIVTLHGMDSANMPTGRRAHTRLRLALKRSSYEEVLLSALKQTWKRGYCC